MPQFSSLLSGMPSHGREDFRKPCVARGVRAVAWMLGVWQSGFGLFALCHKAEGNHGLEQ